MKIPLLRFSLGLFLFGAPLWATELPVLGLANVGVRTSDLARSRAYYRDVCGFETAFETKQPDGLIGGVYLKVNDLQYIVLEPGFRATDVIAITHFAIRTEQIEKLHEIIGRRGLKPGPIAKGADGNLAFSIRNLPAQEMDYIEFVQYTPGSLSDQDLGRHLGERRLAKDLEHVGIITTNYAAAYEFYRRTLGFQDRYRRLTYDRSKVVLEQLRMPGPNINFVELFNQTGETGPVTRKRARGPVHFACVAPDAMAVFQETVRRGVGGQRKPPRYAWDNRYNMNIFDPDGTRIEYMQVEDKARPTPLVVYTPEQP